MKANGKSALAEKGQPRSKNINIEAAVKRRYAKGAEKKEAALCCPIEYDAQFLKVLPEEILEKDYGCGDPSRYLKKGDTVLDLGSGTGKICYIASQVVGPKGKVIGVDFNPAMLALAEKYRVSIAKKIGWDNVRFLRARIQDLATDLSKVETELCTHPVTNLEDFERLNEKISGIREKPLIADESIDVVVSNCVLNLVNTKDKQQLFREIHRVLKRGGHAAISDIVSDEEVPEELQKDAELWSGCISGAFEERAFIRAFEEAGFYGIKIERRDSKPWRVVQGIEFRAVTVTAYKGKEGECWERNQAVIYKGPWKAVEDDDQHLYQRGVRTAVCDKTFQLLMKPPYAQEFEPVVPEKEIPFKKAKPFDCSRNTERNPRETKGLKYKKSTTADSGCMEGACC